MIWLDGMRRHTESANSRQNANINTVQRHWSRSVDVALRGQLRYQ